MIVCHKCSNNIYKEEDDGGYVCKFCDEKYPIINSVTYFDQSTSDKEYNFNEYQIEIDKIYNAERDHFWFKSRRNLILQVFNKFISKKDKIIEIGAGTGSIAMMLSNNDYDLSIGELHPSGIEYFLRDNNRKLPIYQFNIMNNPFKEHFDVVGLFDVLEHIKDDKLAIRHIYNMLKPNGKVVLTVPAHMWLWCEEDEVSNHFKRYELDNLKKMLISEGFTISYATHFFLSIIPLLYIRTKSKASNNIKINPIINLALSIASNIENKLLNFISFRMGGSIIMVGEKNNY